MSTPDTFRDALAQAIGSPFDGDVISDRPSADAVLASDEMQAIRPVLRWVGEYALRFDWHLPESVIRWVLDDPSPDSEDA